MEFNTKLNKLKWTMEKLENADKFEDLCDEYQFDKLGDEEFFNDRFQYLKDLVEKDRSRDFHYDIDRQILFQSNVDFMIYGPKGMGKSNIFMHLMKYWQRRYREIKHKRVNTHGLVNYIGFSDSQFRSIIRIIKEGDILGRDESPIASGEGKYTDTNALQNFIDQTREYQTSAIFVNPEKIEKLSGIDYYIEVAGKRGVYICKTCNIKFINQKICPECRKDTEIIYPESTTRCIWYDRRGIIMGFIYIPLHDDEEFRKKYHEKKISNLKSTVIHGGEVSSQYDKEQFKKDLINLYKFCMECNANSLADVRTHFTNYNLQFDPQTEPEKLIVGYVNYKKDIIRNVVNAIKGNLRGNPLKDYVLEHREELETIEEVNQEAMEKKLAEIQVEIQDEAKEDEFSLFLTQYYYKLLPDNLKTNQKNSVEKDIILEILDLWASKTGIRDISFSVEVHQGIVNDILILFKTGKRQQTTILDDWRVYKMYEYWCSYKYNLKIISGHKKPDWILTCDKGNIPGECKLFDNIKNSIRIHKEKKLHSYKEFKEDLNYIPVLVRNVKWGNFDLLFKVPVNDDPYFTFINDPEYIIEIIDPDQFKDIYKNKGFNYEET